MYQKYIALAALGSSSLICTTMAQAQTIERPQVVFEHAGWAFQPVWDRGEESLAGFYAYPTADVISLPGNIVRIWFESREDNAWGAYAVDPSDIASTVDQIEDAGGEGGVILLIEEVLIEDPSMPMSGPAGPITAGLIQSDPMIPIVENASQPNLLTQLLASVGYAAAPSLSAPLSTSSNAGTVSGEMKQALNCLRGEIDPFASMTNCMVCRCSTHFTGYTPTPPGTWTVTSSIRNGNRRCTYRRNGTASYWKTGEKGEPPCVSCAVGSATAPIGPVPVREVGTAYVDGTGPCPPNPESTYLVIR